MTAATDRRNRRANARSRRRACSQRAAHRLTTMQVGGTTGTMSWFSRGAMRNQYETGAIKATYSYTDINNNLRVAHDAAGLTTSTYDGDNLRRKIVSGSVTTTFVWDGADYLQIKPATGDATLLVVLEGEVVGHVKGSEKRDYIVDPLGSVVAYLNSSQTLTDQFEYWPYGEMVAEVEAGTEPFLWVGSLGYFRESDLRTYIRAREYRQDLGSWMQLDPLWPTRPAFQFVWPKRRTLRARTMRGGRRSPLEQIEGSSYKDVIPTFFPSDDLVFRYGNYCGKENVDFRACRSDPIDCVDAACQEHDDCLASCGGSMADYWSLCGMKCHCILLAKANGCLQLGCMYDSHTQDEAGLRSCWIASGSVASAFVAICTSTIVTGPIVSIGQGIVNGISGGITAVENAVNSILPTREQWWSWTGLRP